MPEKQNISKRLDRDHPILSEDSPLNRHLCRAAGVPDVKSLLLALAHPMSEDDMRILAQKAGNHQAHHNRVKHLREHAVKKHGHVGERHPQDEENPEDRYPDRRRKPARAHREDAGLGEFEYLHKAFKVTPFVPLHKTQSAIGRTTSKDPVGVSYAPEPTGVEPQGKFGPAPKTTAQLREQLRIARTPAPVVSARPSRRTKKQKQETPEPPLPARGMPGSLGPSRHQTYYDPEAGRTRTGGMRMNGAGYMEAGPPHEPFRAKINFNMQDPHEAAIHDTLKNKLGHRDPSNIGNTILYQDFLPDPHDPTKGVGNTGAPGSERSQMAANIAAVHGGLSKEQVHLALDRFHNQALDQFNAHPMHSMDDVTIPHVIHNKDGSVEQTTKYAVERDKDTNLPIHRNAGTKPIELKHLARQIRWWQSIPEDQKNATRKWYNTEAHEYIKDLSRAAKVSYLKAAGALALYNNGMGWETGASGAAQSLFNDPLGVEYKTDGTHNEPTGEIDPETDKPVTKKVPHKAGEPMKILRQTYPAVQEKIRNIVAAPDDDHDEVMKRIRKHLKTNKLGNFFMDMIGAAPYATNTNDRHELALAGHTYKPGTVRDKKDLSGLPHETASDAEHRYFWRVKNAVAHQLDVDPREVQAANWVAWRRNKQSGTDKGENFPGWPVVRKFIDDKMLENTPPEKRSSALKRIRDRKDREIDLANIMPGMPTVQPGMSRKLAADVKKERTRLGAELEEKRKKGANAVIAQQERWAETNPEYKQKRDAALARAVADKERKAEARRQKKAAKNAPPEEEEEEKSWTSWEIDFYNEQLRKSYESLKECHPINYTYLLLRRR